MMVKNTTTMERYLNAMGFTRVLALRAVELDTLSVG
jgi:hypothetical protein